MSFSYSGDPSTSDLDAVRFLLQDVESSEHFFEDEELTYLLTTYLARWNSTTAVAAFAAEILSNRFAREMSVSGDGVTIDTASLQQRFADMATSLRELYEAEALTSELLDDFSGVLAHGFDDSLAPLSFGVGMHDFIDAGDQSQGRPQAYFDELKLYGG